MKGKRGNFYHMLNSQKIAELRNAPHMKELFDIIESMKNPPENIKDDADVQAVMEMASILETDVKNIIMEASLEPVGTLDAMQLVEKTNALNRCIMDYTEAEKSDDTQKTVEAVKHIREIGQYFANLEPANGE